MKKLKQILGAIVTIVLIIFIAPLSPTRNNAQPPADTNSFKTPGKDSALRAILANDTITYIIKKNRESDKLGDNLLPKINSIEKNAKKSGTELDETVKMAKELNKRPSMRMVVSSKPDTQASPKKKVRHNLWYRALHGSDCD